MSGTNDFLPFATGGGANVQSQATYAADPQTSTGQVSGIASSARNNKALRQASSIAAALAQFMANTSGNNVVDDGNQANLLATMALTWPTGVAPTQTKLTTTGTTAGYLFYCSTANATAGATYANNTNTYTVLFTLASGTLLYCSGAGAPTASGTLTKQTGTGDSTITFASKVALAAYNLPANCRRIRVRAVGGGGGGTGTTGSAGQGANGTDTTFGLLLAGGGNRGGVQSTTGASGGAGGTVVASGIVGLAFNGSSGSGGGVGTYVNGGSGGGTPFSGAGGGGNGNNSAYSAVANSGSGGGGAGGANVANAGGGGGGGAGAYFDALITSPLSVYYYCIGLGGAGGTGATNGGAGADGIILIDESYS